MGVYRHSIRVYRMIIRLFLLLLFTFQLSACANKNHLTPPLLEGEFSLIVNVEGLVCCEGTLRLGVYHDKAFWMSETGMVRGRIGMVSSQTQKVEIHGLPKGNYAIAVHQDLNGDGKLNRRLGLIPKEPYGFSNNVGKYGPAAFGKASIYLDKDREITIVLNTVP